jgi:predicted ATPase
MDYIEILGYKSIRNARIDLMPINVFIGANGSGKSNFLSFFEFLYHLYNKKLQEYINLKGGEDRILHRGGKVTQEISFKLEFDNGQNGYSAILRRGDTGLIFTSERLHFMGDTGRNISTYSLEARVKDADNFRAPYVLNYLDSLKKYHFHETGRNSPFNSLSHINNDTYFLYERGDNIAAFLYNIKETNKLHYNRIVQAIQSIAPFFLDFYFQPNEQGYIRLQWQDKYSSTIYGATDLSDGTIRFIALCTLFLQPGLPSTVIIDEPELGLHPFAISKLAGMIQSAAARNVQVIVATQSADLVNHFKAEDIVTVDQREGESFFKRLEGNSLRVWLDEYNIGDLWQKNIIQGGQPA